MTVVAAFHSSAERHNFLGLRTSPRGAMEIVFDDGSSRRRIWRVRNPIANPSRIGEALKAAVDQARVLPALYSELRKREITIEDVTGS